MKKWFEEWLQGQTRPAPFLRCSDSSLLRVTKLPQETHILQVIVNEYALEGSERLEFVKEGLEYLGQQLIFGKNHLEVRPVRFPLAGLATDLATEGSNQFGAK